MPKLRIRIHRERLDQAWENWTKAFGAGSTSPFWKFIGLPDNKYFPYWMTDEQEQRLNLLLGPHHYAIIKAYKAKHKKEKK